MILTWYKIAVKISCPVELVRDKMKDFTDNFCSYDFTGIFHNDESSDDSDSKKQPVLL